MFEQLLKTDLNLKRLINRVHLLAIGNRILAAVIIFIVLLIISFAWMLAQLPERTIARGVTVGLIDVGGLSIEKAQYLIESQTDALESNGLTFVYKNISFNVGSVNNVENNPELSQVVFKYSPEETIKKAYNIGHVGSLWQQYSDRLWARIFGQKVSLDYSLDNKQAEKIFKQNLSIYDEQSQDANLRVVWRTSKPEVELVKEFGGKVFDYTLALNDLKNHLDTLDSSMILMRQQISQPQILMTNALILKPNLENILSKGELILVYKDQNYKIPTKEWSKWVSVVKNNEMGISLGINEVAIDYLKNNIAPKIELPVQEAKFLVKNGRVEEFQAGETGEQIDYVSTIAGIQNSIVGNASTTLVISIIKMEPAIGVDKINDMGIKELVSVGKTSFKGSPPNRRHNIAVGAKALNGILIAPGEEFSTIKRLSPIEAKSGYLPELVIKNNTTKPEYGGGLCQISTTLFRAVLNAGLPVLERHNHAYRVSYYEPPIGMDATIYDPKPDFRFINDTGKYLLLQTGVKGDEVIFEFWGTKDGREIIMSTPKTFNPKSPPAPRLIETLSLPVGQKKCTEKAHAGIDTMFNYTVVYSNGEKKSEDFYSHYKPWGEVCAIGVAKLTESAPAVDTLISNSASTSVNSTVPEIKQP